MKIKNKILVGFITLIGLNILALRNNFNAKAIFLIIVSNLCLSAVIFLLNGLYKRASEQIKKAVNIFLWLVTVPFMFWIVQMLAVEQFAVNRKYLLYNLSLYLIIWVVFSALFRKVKVGAVIYVLLFSIIAVADYYVTLFRGQPFMLIDLINIETAATVVSTYQFEVTLKMECYLEFLWLFLMLQILFQNLEYQKKLKIKMLRAVGTVICVAGTVVVLLSLKNANAIEAVDLWDTKSDYTNKGLVYTLMAEGQYLSVEKPKGYTEDKVEEVLTKLEPKESQDNSVVPENIIVIMNESWADLELINDIKSGSSFMPYIKSLRKEFSNGYLHVPVFGAGTAETEYEVLTGNTKNFLPAGSVAYKLYVNDPEYGLAYTLKMQGYETVAVHPYFGENWNRIAVYEKMKFDDFISMQNWNAPMEALRTFASDESTYDRILRLYDSKDQGKKLFTFCVTMQNHGGYDADSSGDFVNTVSLNYENDYPLAETYLSEINVTDEAFKKLVNHFENSDEKTMIVMFGDHLPAVETEFYETLFGRKIEELNVEELQKRYMTPYIIWTNYKCERNIEDMSSNYLGSYILEQAGLDMTSYEESLLKLKETLPVIGQGAICDSEGKWYSLDSELPDEYAELLNEYQILQYNNMFDKTNLVSDIK